MKRSDVVLGERFGRWMIIDWAEARLSSGGWPISQVSARCDCGTVKMVDPRSLRNGKSKSCGCLKQEISRHRATKHGMCGTGLYECWMNMKQRSSGHYTRKAYADVGRDARWDSFDDFRSDMEATYFPRRHTRPLQRPRRLPAR